MRGYRLAFNNATNETISIGATSFLIGGERVDLECAFCHKKVIKNGHYTLYHIHNGVKYWFCTYGHLDQWYAKYKAYCEYASISVISAVLSKECHICLKALPAPNKALKMRRYNLIYVFCGDICRDIFSARFKEVEAVLR